MPQRPLVYLLHGLLGTAYAHFGRQISAWRGGYRPVPIDLPGHGRCPLDAQPDYYDDALRYVLALLDRFGPGRLIGASYLGGPLAVRAAAARPHLVGSLVLTGFVPDTAEDAFQAQIAGFEQLAAEHPELADEYERLHSMRWKQTLGSVVAHAGRDFAGTVRVSPQELTELGIRTLLINGSLKSAERAAAESAARLGGPVSGHVVPGAGHLVSRDAPEQFIQTVETFWHREAEHDFA
ncbi:alpha/beta fold hydrolase [Streptomyces verrucosisporus]|uniref:alpha/beta fold hydrolase n=1 Tax=Streptomyces verrucosisporus TaxID=1695161 RepID=UPI0019D2E6BB|nr:alpha/beta fold hydrolase [Streptomyces verrucosisporus]MBN3932620.1 alpha/beta fold hydrolase [Streptomyces verrucosisporus]